MSPKHKYRVDLVYYGWVLIRWLITGISVTIGGLATGLAPMFVSQGQTFNFDSTYNSKLMFVNIAWCLFISFLLFVARNPIPSPEIEVEIDTEEPDTGTKPLPATPDAPKAG